MGKNRPTGQLGKGAKLAAVVFDLANGPQSALGDRRAADRCGHGQNVLLDLGLRGAGAMREEILPSLHSLHLLGTFGQRASH